MFFLNASLTPFFFFNLDLESTSARSPSSGSSPPTRLWPVVGSRAGSRWKWKEVIQELEAR